MVRVDGVSGYSVGLTGRDGSVGVIHGTLYAAWTIRDTGPSGGATMDVGDWLRSLGLGQYLSVFHENDIDAEVLAELTEADFEKIGISLGHRKRMLKAIAALDASRRAVAPALDRSGPFADPTPSTDVRFHIRRASPPGRHVLRPCRLDQHIGETRRRGLARSRRQLSRRRLGGGDADGRARRQKARRRDHGAVWLSDRPRERFGTRGARMSGDPARARRA